VPGATGVRGTDDDWQHRPPGRDDVGLVIEVSLGTLGRDQNEKLPDYARSGIPAYWITSVPRSAGTELRPAAGSRMWTSRESLANPGTRTVSLYSPGSTSAIRNEPSG
jgi:Uma2 family endonuclease